MTLKNFSYHSILEDNPIIFNNTFISPLEMLKQYYITQSYLHNNEIIINDKYNIKNVITTEHSGFVDKTFKESFIRWFSKREEGYFKIILDKTLKQEWEDVILFDINGKSFNRDGNHRIMLYRLLNYYNLIDTEIKNIKIDYQWNYLKEIK